MDENLNEHREPIGTAQSESASDAFGCCSRYRQCSDVGKCLIPEENYSVNCLYRKSLESGIIFYGKNSKNFDPLVYDRFVSAYQALSVFDQEALCSVLTYFFVEKANTTRELFYDCPELFALADSGFFELHTQPRAILEKYKDKPLREKCKSILPVVAEWSRSLCITPEEIEEWNLRASNKVLKSELIDWICLYCPSVRGSLCDGLHYVVIPLDTRQELLEFYLDYLFRENSKSGIERISDPRFLLNQNVVLKYHSNSKNLSEKEKAMHRSHPQKNAAPKYLSSNHDLSEKEQTAKMFGPWDRSISETLDGIKRIHNSKELPPKRILFLDRTAQSAVFKGSREELYSVTLSSCDCMDFAMQGLPCKHIYRLACELGYEIPFPEFDPRKASEYDVSEDISRLTNRWRSGQLTTDSYIKCVEALQKSAAKAKR